MLREAQTAPESRRMGRAGEKTTTMTMNTNMTMTTNAERKLTVNPASFLSDFGEN
jgi:hypothetical protein